MIYIFKHPQKEEYIEVAQGINEEHIYFDDSGAQWERVYTSPDVSVKENVDPFNSKQFVETTGRKKGTVGNLIEASAELGEARKRVSGGKDPIQEKYFEDYSKKRRGKKHPNDPSIKKDASRGGLGITYE